MLKILKEHPVAIGLFVLYILSLVWLGFIGYYDFTGRGDGETLGMSTFGFVIMFYGPYLAILIWLYFFAKRLNDFYGRLAIAVVAVGIIAIIVILSILKIFLK